MSDVLLLFDIWYTYYLLKVRYILNMKKYYLVLMVLMFFSPLFVGAQTNSSDQIQGILNNIKSDGTSLVGSQKFEPLKLSVSEGKILIEVEELQENVFDVLIKGAEVKNIDEKGNINIDVLGLNASIVLSQNARVVSEGWNKISIESIKAGDKINVWGIYNESASGDILVKTLRRLNN